MGIIIIYLNPILFVGQVYGSAFIRILLLPPRSSRMSSVLFGRGINTQTGGKKKADDVTRDIEAIKGQVAVAASISSSNRVMIDKCNALMSTLEGRLSGLLETVGGLQTKVKELEERKDKSKSKVTADS
jgi:hypothetical protein